MIDPHETWHWGPALFIVETEAPATYGYRMTCSPRMLLRWGVDVSSRPRTAEQWWVYLAGYSADFLRVADADRLQVLGAERCGSGWLGFAGADQDALTAVEERLGTALPAGYGAFLEASDGWLEMGPFVWAMRTTADVGWLRGIEPDLLSAVPIQGSNSN